MIHQGLLAFCDFFWFHEEIVRCKDQNFEDTLCNICSKKKNTKLSNTAYGTFFFGTDVSKTSKWFQILSKVHFLMILDTQLLTFWEKSKILQWRLDLSKRHCKIFYVSDVRYFLHKLNLWQIRVFTAK